MICVTHRRREPYLSKSAGRGAPSRLNLLRDVQGAALLEFAISLPLLVVFVVGIYDFSGAFTQKLKIEQAAQAGAIVAGAQPMSDIQSSNSNPDSLQAVVAVVFNALAGSGVMPNAKPGSTCVPPGTPSGPTQPGLQWTYTISGCDSANDSLTIVINRASVLSGSPETVGTSVTVTYPYHWRFNSVIQLLAPGASYAPASLSESATVHNQI